MKHAGVSASDATFVEAEYDYDDGRMVYEVEFHVKGTEYDYEIDAQTGEVVKYKTEQNGANTGSSTNTSSFIGESAAKQAALSHARGEREQHQILQRLAGVRRRPRRVL